MTQEKTYTIGGLEFVLSPLTLRQKRDAYGIESRIRDLYAELESIDGTEIDASKLVSLARRSDEIILSEEFPRWLATVLSPKGEKWCPEFIEKHAPVMEEIDEETQEEVLRDFFVRSLGSISGPRLCLVPSLKRTDKSTGSFGRHSPAGTDPSASSVN